MDSAAMNELRAVLARVHREVGRQLAALDAVDYAAGQLRNLGVDVTMSTEHGALVMVADVDRTKLANDVARWKALEAGAQPLPLVEPEPIEEPEPVEDVPAPVVEAPEAIEDGADWGECKPCFGGVLIPTHLVNAVEELGKTLPLANLGWDQFVRLVDLQIAGRSVQDIAAELRRPTADIAVLIRNVAARPVAARELRDVIQAGLENFA